MVLFTSRTGWPIKIVRTAIELTVLATGWLMGGTVGIGTVLYALTIGWVVHYALPLFTVTRRPGKPQAAAAVA